MRLLQCTSAHCYVLLLLAAISDAAAGGKVLCDTPVTANTLN
jgi:hypothetical protein